MGIMLTALKLAFQRGKGLDKVLADPMIRVIGAEFENLRTLIRQIPLEANPGTATYTLPEWHDALGQRYEPTLPIDTQRARLEAQRLAIGGMTIRQLQSQVDKEFTDITITEVSASSECGVEECGVSLCGAVEGDFAPTFYVGVGLLEDDEQVRRLTAILERYAPAHLMPYSSVVVLSESATSETGIATCGIEETGYMPDEEE